MVIMAWTPLYYRLSGGDLDKLFEQAYQVWTPLPLKQLGIPADNLATEAGWHALRGKLYNAGRLRRYAVQLSWNMAERSAMIMTRPSPYANLAPRHINPG